MSLLSINNKDALEACAQVKTHRHAVARVLRVLLNPPTAAIIFFCMAVMSKSSYTSGSMHVQMCRFCLTGKGRACAVRDQL